MFAGEEFWLHVDLLEVQYASARQLLIIICLGFVVKQVPIFQDEIPLLPPLVEAGALLLQDAFVVVVLGQLVVEDGCPGDAYLFIVKMIFRSSV